MTYLKRSVLFAGFLLSITFAAQSYSSVVINGTRVIYPAAAREKALQLTSHDSYPNLVQIWLDKGNPQSTPLTSDAPFVASPQIFRMNPQAGQVVRLIYTGTSLPQDRESVFYLNVMQMPAIKSTDLEANKLLLTINSRMKVFYRPEGIQGSSDEISQALSFKVRGSGSNLSVEAENHSNYYAVVREASLINAEKPQGLVKAVMIAPKSKAQWPISPLSNTANAKTQLRITLVNDFGTDVTNDFPLQ